MSDRADIARRHQLPPRMAAELRGDTPEQLEADAAAKGAILRMLGAPIEPAELPPENLPPRDKPLTDYTPAEREAVSADLERKLTQRERADAVEQHDDQEEPDFHAVVLGLSASEQRAAKQHATRSIAESLHAPRGER